ncbi:MAG: MBL fold metallo-hydrolase [Geminicoccaceae bacterium]
MRVTVLGCGTSAGVPQIGCECAVCRSPDPRNKRLRCSILVETRGQKILFDTGPDLRRQCLDAGIGRLDALVYTHAHADHLHGLDDIRAINNIIGRPLPAHAHADVLQRIKGASLMPSAAARAAGVASGGRRSCPGRSTGDGPFAIGPVEILPLAHGHRRSRVWGFRIGNFAYSTDRPARRGPISRRSPGSTSWLVDALRDDPHPSPPHLRRTLEWIARVRPKQAWLLHEPRGRLRHPGRPSCPPA